MNIQDKLTKAFYAALDNLEAATKEGDEVKINRMQRRLNIVEADAKFNGAVFSGTRFIKTIRQLDEV